MGATPLSESLKSNTTLTQLNLSREDKRKKEDTKDTYQQFTLFLSIHVNRQQHWRHRCYIIEWIIEIKHNTNNARSGWWRQNKEDTQKTSINNSLFFFLFTPTGNGIRDKGASSLSESLKSNTTLIELDLSGEDRRNKIHKRHPSTIYSCHFFFSNNR